MRRNPDKPARQSGNGALCALESEKFRGFITDVAKRSGRFVVSAHGDEKREQRRNELVVSSHLMALRRGTSS